MKTTPGTGNLKSGVSKGDGGAKEEQGSKSKHKHRRDASVEKSRDKDRDRDRVRCRDHDRVRESDRERDQEDADRYKARDDSHRGTNPRTQELSKSPDITLRGIMITTAHPTLRGRRTVTGIHSHA